MSATNKKLKLDIEGMHCAACSSRIERVVSKLDGVETIQVNLANETAELVIDEQTVTYDSVDGAIKRLGFSSSISVDPVKEYEKKKRQRVRNLKNRKKSC